jgi:putative phosphoesterase
VKIGIVSDTHGSISRHALKMLRDEGVEHIIHAGDICASSVLFKLEDIAPVTAVLGNCDFDDFGPDVKREAEVTLDGVTFYVVHRPQDVGYVDPTRIDVVVTGHTHVENIERKRGVLFVNPGSITRPRGAQGGTIAIVETKHGFVESARIVSVLHRS